ncbi:MAG: PEGA domain-containing protein [Lachnospiraceae bacterium]|nr:PEGA domain-containing protein [Lachnospiraceae bacterium]
MRKQRRVSKRIQYAGILATVTLMLSACGAQGGIKDLVIAEKEVDEEAEVRKETTGFKTFAPGEYDSYDTAVVVKVNETKSEVTFLNTVVDLKYTLSYDGTTTVYDRTGQALSIAQLAAGDIVNVKFRRLPKKAVSIEQNADNWKYTNISDYSYQFERSEMTIDGKRFSLADRMVLMSGNEEMDEEDLNENDIVKISGLDKTVYAISVERGHGYLRLKGTDYFVGGWIEVGNKYVQRITKDMLLTVPEGDYKVVVRNGKIGGTMQVVIHSGEETQLDLSELKGEEVKTGNIFFTMYPTDAKVYIDGNLVDTSTFVTLEYGLHQMIVRASGYETISQYLRVGQDNANLHIEMEPELTGKTESDKKEEGGVEDENAVYNALPTEDQINAGKTGEPTDTEQTGNAESPDTTKETTTKTPQEDDAISADNGERVVKINAPESAEVYVDGNYVGIVPTTFPKEKGTHVVSLRKSGYQTRSYTIQVDGSDKDMELSFSELVPRRTE